MEGERDEGAPDLRWLAFAAATTPLRLLEVARRVPLMADGAGAIAEAVPGVVDTVAANTDQLAETTVALGRVGDTLQEVLKRIEAVERAGQRLGRLIDSKG